MSSTMKVVPINSIHQSKSQLRDVNEDTPEFKAMVSSMLMPAGLMNPISIREQLNKDTNETEPILVDGAQRLAACKAAGFTEIKCNVLDIDEAEAMYAQIIGNAMKIETKHYQYAKQLTRALALDPTASVAKLAERSKLRPEYIRKLLKLDNLDPAIGKMVDEHSIDLMSAMAIAELPTELHGEWAEKAIVAEKTVEFVTELQTFNRQRKAALREGKALEEVVFEADPRMRKAGEITALLAEDAEKNIATIVGKAKTAVESAKMILDWMFQLDPATVEDRKAKFEAMQAQRKAQSEKNKVQAKERMLKSKQEKLEQLKKELAEVQSAAQT